MTEVRTAAAERALGRADRGCLVLADISGYTTYLLGVELEHAHDVLADLTETVVKNLQPVLTLSKLEGDAAFAYALAGRLDGGMLLDTIDQAYLAFRARLRDIRQATTCDCNACVAIPSLNLKFVVHDGLFVRRSVAGREELTGGDVILVHRLLKNSVAESFGLRGYALFTEQCVEAIGIEPELLGLQEHVESYDDVGEVRGWVADLEARWQEEQERRRVFVAPDEASFTFEARYPAAPPVVWEWITTPAKRALWQADRVDQVTAGRRGAGVTNHCVHGSQATVEHILDWRPFHYLTARYTTPRFGEWTWTIELRPDGGDTHVSIRGERLRGTRRLLAPLVLPMLRKQLRADTQRLSERLGAEAAAAN